MGIDVFSAKFLLEQKVSGAVLTIGRQALFGENADYSRLLGIGIGDFEGIRAESEGLCEGLLRHLGAASVDSLDYSGYEGATILHDLSDPIPGSLRERFDLVIDGGSLEHVFNYPVGLRNCMEMVRRGGKLTIITPADNQCGHGFYQISPELMFRALSPANGYELQNAFLRIGESSIVELDDPAKNGARNEIRTGAATLMYVSAIRREPVEIFRTWPQQSDYAATWAQSGS